MKSVSSFEVQVRHHLFFTNRPLLRLLGLQLLPLHRLVQLVVREVRVTSKGSSHIILRRSQGGGDPMVVDHWFRQIEKVFEAIRRYEDQVSCVPARG